MVLTGSGLVGVRRVRCTMKLHHVLNLKSNEETSHGWNSSNAHKGATTLCLKSFYGYWSTHLQLLDVSLVLFVDQLVYFMINKVSFTCWVAGFFVYVTVETRFHLQLSIDDLVIDLLWKICQWLLYQLHEKVCCFITVLELQPQNVPKVIVWNRSTSSQSSASRHPLATTSKDDTDDTGSECVEDFCMISGSHSSTLDRLYAWERKLYDEVKVFLTLIPLHGK